MLGFNLFRDSSSSSCFTKLLGIQLWQFTGERIDKLCYCSAWAKLNTIIGLNHHLPPTTTTNVLTSSWQSRRLKLGIQHKNNTNKQFIEYKKSTYQSKVNSNLRWTQMQAEHCSSASACSFSAMIYFCSHF